MKFTKEDLELQNGLKKEWLITNGIGGFASSTILGANTRKYHGLLIAPLVPPARRFLILSKVDESIEIEGKKYNLYTNVGENYISQGFKYQKKFEKEYLPIFKYEVENVEITKTICMEYGKNTVGIQYKIKNSGKPIKLNLAPIVNFRDFHSMSIDHIFNVKQEIKNKKVKLIIDENPQTPVYMNISEGSYIKHENDTFTNMFYIEEEKRGFYPKENHSVPGVYQIEIKPNEEKEISLICSLEENIEEIDVKELIKKEITRLEKEVEKGIKGKEDTKILRELILSSEQFIVYRPSFRLHTIIAGYPWFLDWGRDSLISFEGLLLATNRFEIAKEVLLTMVRDIKYGLVPNGYSGFDNRPLYNSVDASLLLFEQVKKYIEYTKDYDFIKENIYPKLKLIIENYSKGIDFDNNNIHLEDDGLISSGTENTQNTWMDAKYGDFAFTPRNGKVVEINALWYNALKIMEVLSKKYEKLGKRILSKKYSQMAEECKESFNKKFYNGRRKCLYDVIGDGKIRPNQLFSLALTYPVVDPSSEMAENIINVVEKKLLNNYGLKTLAKGEKNYVDIYEGDGFRRDASYHQGITWPWLLGLYYNSLRNMKAFEKDKEKKKAVATKIDEFKKRTEKTFRKEMNESGCIGSISELYDSKTPYLPKGAFAQGWSVAEVFRIIFG